jgi:hypothetical protein
MSPKFQNPNSFSQNFLFFLLARIISLNMKKVVDGVIKEGFSMLEGDYSGGEKGT